jgi:hypothetical protein
MMELMITAHDFEMLTVGSMDLRQDYEPLYVSQADRFENILGAGPGVPPRKAWTYAHWTHNDWADVVLAKSFLIDTGHDFEVFFDYSYPDNDRGGYVIFTDYEGRH